MSPNWRRDPIGRAPRCIARGGVYRTAVTDLAPARQAVPACMTPAGAPGLLSSYENLCAAAGGQASYCDVIIRRSFPLKTRVNYHIGPQPDTIENSRRALSKMKSPLLRFCVFAAIVSLASGRATAQSDAEQLTPILAQAIQTPDVTAYQLRQYLMGRVAPLPASAGAAEWTLEAKRIRRHLLDDVVFHGWPAEWVNAPPKFEEAGVIEGNGYRIRKFRYEIVPGFQSTALLYEPDHLTGKIPAILNVNGHVGPLGKAIEYTQKPCVNYSKHGILALSLEWLAFGELTAPENDHAFAAHLDLVGMNGVGLFYLAMRRGLDYLYEHPNTDRSRLGVTGLSGGGWQTIMLSSLDPRVTVAVPVAGYSAFLSKLERVPGYEDNEQYSQDFL